MFQPESYLRQLTDQLQARFGSRLVYVGLQGSYMRGEATEASDIDPMVVIDGLTPADLAAYREIIGSLPDPDKACGFTCGKEDLAHWNPLEISHLLHCTRDYYGQLASLVPAFTRADTINFVRLSINNLYHELCHRYLHGSREKNILRLPGSCKGVFFILQNLHYLDSGTYAVTRAELLSSLSGIDRAVLDTSIRLSRSESFDFDEVFALLMQWCQETLARLCNT